MICPLSTTYPESFRFVNYFTDRKILFSGMCPCFDLGLIRKRCQGGRSVITSRTSSADRTSDPSPARPLRSPLLGREPARPGLLAATRARGAVCGARREKKRSEGSRGIPGKAERREAENARWACQVGRDGPPGSTQTDRHLQNSAVRRGGGKSLLSHLTAPRQLTWFSNARSQGHLPFPESTDPNRTH